MSEHPDFSEAADRLAGEAVVLVQFDRSGYEEISRTDLVLESARAVERAMDTIKSMGERVSVTVASLGRRPAGVEVSFGIALEAEAGALIAKAKESTSRSSGTSGGRRRPVIFSSFGGSPCRSSTAVCARCGVRAPW
jgi:hypothetical protein